MQLTQWISIDPFGGVTANRAAALTSSRHLWRSPIQVAQPGFMLFASMEASMMSCTSRVMLSIFEFEINWFENFGKQMNVCR